MIGNIFILNNNFETIGIVDTYKSLIWAKRYNDLGDCELYVPASNENMNLLKRGYYIRRSDDDMVCRIKKVELDTSPEDGNYLIVTGYDVKQWLDQRVIWDTVIIPETTVEQFLRGLIVRSLINPTNPNRKITDENGNQILKIDTHVYFTPMYSGQISYKNVGETIREYCKEYGWGYRIVRKNDGFFYFQFYEGIDRSNTVVFADEYENLSTTKYILDDTNIENVALIAGAGSGSERTRAVIGDTKSADRYELFVDAKDISKNIQFEELLEMYPDTAHGGYGRIVVYPGNQYVYEVSQIDILIGNDEYKNDEYRNWLLAEYPGGVIFIDDNNNIFYQITHNLVIADLPNNSPSDNDTVILRDVLYKGYLFTKGDTDLAEYGAKTVFEGTAIPEMQYKYKEDYDLGDLVNIRTSYGISATARITEVVEVSDENGYRIEPKLEYNIS